jgi:tetratricopeptide (TPR) repeat protein
MDVPPSMTAEQVEIYNKAYERAVGLLEGAIQLHDAPKAQDGAQGRLREAVAALDTCLELVPNSFACEFMAGKACQALGEHENALRRFSRAVELESANPDTAREATIEALRLGKAEEAGRFARDACRRSPRDAGLVANLALAYLISGDLQEALKAAARAVEMDDSDPVNRSVLGLAQDVSTGARPRPKMIG